MAAARLGHPVVALISPSGQDCVLVSATPSMHSPALVDPASLRPFSQITDTVACAVSGVPGDGLLQVELLRQFAEKHEAEYGVMPSAGQLALQLADHAQRLTQEAETRPLGSSVLIIGPGTSVSTRRHDTSLQLFRVEPTGSLLRCKAGALGQGTQAMESKISQWLDDTEASEQQPTKDELVEAAIACLEVEAKVARTTNSTDASPTKAVHVGTSSLENGFLGWLGAKPRHRGLEP
eukprot:CAMPEP_0118969742 /NCGR_PEP_ID=MMETSP1173-20130426/6788_1 /TAXON_ID=1034831 /ORGANISM="Rhizochromulina marina cf, Strain CCMP1243" /LENGTH=235 /DNA_ID=CAMNT_0006919019 /DNA_START=41 /DNA_END=745 /DNA_ORIENTATION=-